MPEFGRNEEVRRARFVEAVKTEANRRILAIVPLWKQNNLNAQANLLNRKGEANWTAEDHAAWDAGEALWVQVAAIRAASNAIELLPLHTDPTDDALWP